VLTGHGLAADRIDEQDMMMRIAASLADGRGDAGPVPRRDPPAPEPAPWLPFQTTVSTFTETLPLMLIGMGLYRGLWNGAWSRPRSRRP
jgi:uncharacterized protein